MIGATEAWVNQLRKIVNDGEKCGDTLEILSSSLCFDMNYPIVANVSRKANYGFMFAEAEYIIKGQSNVTELEPHISKFGEYSDMYPLQQGSYGPPFVEQLRYVVDTLWASDLSRQAVMTIWRQNPRKSKDIPCTIALQFLIRNDKLHTIVTMRSSDAFTGLVYDMFCFSAMSAVVLTFLDFSDVTLGNCWINAGSSHLYDKDAKRYLAIDVADIRPERYVFADSYDGIIKQLHILAESAKK